MKEITKKLIKFYLERSKNIFRKRKREAIKIFSINIFLR